MMYALKSLNIRKHGEVSPAELQFSEGMNVLLGKNAAGKSTLLNIIYRVLSGRIHMASDVEYSLSYMIEFGDKCELSVDIDCKKRVLSEAEKLSIQNGESKFALEYVQTGFAKISIPRYHSVIDITIAEEYLEASEIELRIAKNFGQFSMGTFIANIFFALRKIHAEKEMNTDMYHMLSGISINFMDEGLDLFKSITKDASVEYSSNDEMNFHYMMSNYINSDHLAMAREVVRERISKAISVMSIGREKSDFLDEAIKLIGAQDGEMSFNLIRAKLEEDNASAAYGDMTMFFNFGKIKYRHNDLSYGQKRLLAFAYVLKQNRHVIIADELVNGLHHGMIERCMELIAGRQSFLTSQNPLLFDHMTLGSLEDVKKSFVICSAKEQKFNWKDIDDDIAVEIYESLKLKFRHISEILQEYNLW